MNVRKNTKYAVACLSSMGLRITPENRMAVHNSNRFLLQATSAETNVLNVTSSLGPECLVMTRFVAGSPMAAFIKAQLRARNIAYVGPDVPQGGPWGFRHQFNIADSGFGLRAPRVWNDRAGEVGRTLDAKDYDTAKIFGKDGVGILHLSGLIAAMRPDRCRIPTPSSPKIRSRSKSSAESVLPTSPALSFQTLGARSPKPESAILNWWRKPHGPP